MALRRTHRTRPRDVVLKSLCCVGAGCWLNQCIPAPQGFRPGEAMRTLLPWQACTMARYARLPRRCLRSRSPCAIVRVLLFLETMPTYDYLCNTCGQTFEVFQSIKDDPLTACPDPSCTGTVKRKIGAGAGIIFKGSGFYQTDYRSASYNAGAKADKPSGGGGASSGSAGSSSSSGSSGGSSSSSASSSGGSSSGGSGSSGS